ncbi:hypothetical protein GCM10010326_66010 [Streptomyces xanthochromogenes]|uniref:Phosphotyrosine protein phosphatase I domain-containing protein n=1 Tax=Streptomyces xanthochromogenes TaxID=67384 RepID=A0ABQ3AN55_9ACTN|nr:hypothetical protein GCM10010326_66010 [Streptomyces xanthochromogenes]
MSENQSKPPTVLFVCVHNAGRSQMAAAFLDHLSLGQVEVRSAGSAPTGSVNPAVVEAMAEAGIDISAQTPKMLTTQAVQASDVVITMGCGDACPVFPGKKYLDWKLDDPAGQGVAAVRPIRDEIERHIRRWGGGLCSDLPGSPGRTSSPGPAPSLGIRCMPSNGSSPSTSIGPRHGTPYRLRRRSTMRRERAVRHPLPDRTATPPSWQSRTLRCATSRLDHGSCPWPAAPSGATLEVTLCGRSACTTPHTVRPTTDGPGPLSPDRLRTPGTPANRWQAPWHPQVTAFPPSLSAHPVSRRWRVRAPDKETECELAGQQQSPESRHMPPGCTAIYRAPRPGRGHPAFATGFRRAAAC